MGYGIGRRRWGEGRTPIRFGTYNIRNGQNGGLKSALRGVGQENVDVEVFQETKLTEGIYTRKSSGYKVVATPAPSQHQGGVAFLYRYYPAFAVKAIRQFGANGIAYQLVTGERRWYIDGCSLEPGDKTTIRDVEAAMAEKPIGVELIFTGDLKVDLEKAGGRVRDKKITVAVVKAGLEDLAVHFFPQRRTWCRDQRMWGSVRQWRVVRSWTDYILGSDHRIFQNVAVWDQRHNSDHFMFVECLCGASLGEHFCYLGHRTSLPLRPNGRQTRIRVSKIFAELWCAVPKPDKRTACHNLWISLDTWRLVNERVSTRREPGQDQRQLLWSRRAIRASLK